MLFLSELTEFKESKFSSESYGKIIGVQGPVLHAVLPSAALGDICKVERKYGKELLSEIISFEHEVVKLAPFDSLEGIFPGARVTNQGKQAEIEIPNKPQGCILNPLGELLYSPHKELTFNRIPLHRKAPEPLTRMPVDKFLPTGIAAIDAFTSLAYGQRIGLFAGAGLGKSTLLGMVAKNANVDVSVIALVGERGREVKEFIDDILGKDGLKKSVVIVSTSDESPARRYLAALTATSIAEKLRAKGKNVLLLVDSITRVARALREVKLSAGELPVRQGFPASVFTELPKLLERTGTDSNGSITALYTVLESDEYGSDILSEELKSILDGHVLLSRKVLQQGMRPCIDCVNSVSRIMERLHSSELKNEISKLRTALARIEKDSDVILMGGKPDAELSAAFKVMGQLKEILNQSPDEYRATEEVFEKIQAVAKSFAENCKEYQEKFK